MVTLCVPARDRKSEGCQRETKTLQPGLEYQNIPCAGLLELPGVCGLVILGIIRGKRSLWFALLPGLLWAHCLSEQILGHMDQGKDHNTLTQDRSHLSGESGVPATFP